MIHAFLGHDQRESAGWHTFVTSLIDKASVPVAIHPLDAKGLPEGSNTFTFSRFLVPWLMGFKGHAIFMDACDMLMLGDIAELDALFDPSKAIQCVWQEYKTRHPVKYIGTEMECPNRDYDRKNWASVFIANAEHPDWANMTPERIAQYAAIPTSLLSLRWLPDDAIGFLPDHWNRLVDEGQAVEGASVLHWTSGAPFMPHYKDAPGADLWRSYSSKRDRAA